MKANCDDIVYANKVARECRKSTTRAILFGFLEKLPGIKIYLETYFSNTFLLKDVNTFYKKHLKKLITSFVSLDFTLLIAHLSTRPLAIDKVQK